jgi:hypothetical protein
MKADEIKSAVDAYRAEELRKMHVRISDRPAWRDPEYAGAQMLEVEARIETYTRSLGEPDADAQPDEPQADANKE